MSFEDGISCSVVSIFTRNVAIMQYHPNVWMTIMHFFVICLKIMRELSGLHYGLRSGFYAHRRIGFPLAIFKQIAKEFKKSTKFKISAKSMLAATKQVANCIIDNNYIRFIKLVRFDLLIIGVSGMKH